MRASLTLVLCSCACAQAPAKGGPSTTPPREAVVLFDGSSLASWQHRGGRDAQWRLVDGAMEVNGSGDILTRQQFGDHLLHVELMIPHMPGAVGQARGNSGVYVHDSYEVQVLDSFGKSEPLGNDECAAIYGRRGPTRNMALAPLEWQTFEIEHRAPRFDGGTLTAHARLGVTWNGVRVHDDVELDSPTGGGEPEQARAPLRLQDHGSPVRYRNLWIVPR